MEARLLMPPESCAGIIFFKTRQSPARLMNWLTWCSRSAREKRFGVQTKADVFFHGEPGKELAFLRNVADFGIEAAHLFALEENPSRRCAPKNPAMSLSKVDLPQPLGPTTVTNSP